MSRNCNELPGFMFVDNGDGGIAVVEGRGGGGGVGFSCCSRDSWSRCCFDVPALREPSLLSDLFCAREEDNKRKPN